MKTRILVVILWGGLILAAFGAIVMLLWNLLIPGILGFASINFWEALGLLVLTRILFGRFVPGRMFMGRKEGRDRNPIREKWMKMTPEERREFVDRRKRFGFGFPFDKGDFFEKHGFGMSKEDEPGKDE